MQDSSITGRVSILTLKEERNLCLIEIKQIFVVSFTTFRCKSRFNCHESVFKL